MNCRLCGSDEGNILYQKRDTDELLTDKYKVVRCKGCGFTYVDPIPDKRDMEILYDSDTYYGTAGNTKNIFHIIEDFFYNTRANKIELLKGRGRILDIGCGSGKFLSFMKKRGWEVYGVESSMRGVNIAREVYNIDVFSGSLNEAGYPERFFDVITLWHVLEHIAEPNLIFKEIKRVVKPEGVLFIAVPDIESLEARIFEDKWFHLDIPRHLSHYSPVTLDMVAARNGFRILKIDYFSLEYNMAGLFQSILNSVGCKSNFFYNKIKRGDTSSPDCYTWAMSWILAAAGLPVIFLLTELTSLLKLSGCIEVHLVREET